MLLTIKDIISDTLLDIDDQSSSQYMRAMRFVERGIGELQLFHGKSYELVKLDIDPSILTAPLPRDYVRYIAVGVYLNGNFYTLTINNSNIKVEDESCGDVSSEQIKYTNTKGMYGHKGGLSKFKECTINEKKNRIEFSTDLTGYNVYLKYVSNGVSSDTKIPVIYREPLIAYTKWKLEKNINEKEYWKKEYYEEVFKLRDAQVPTLDEYYDAILQSSTQTATR